MFTTPPDVWIPLFDQVSRSRPVACANSMTHCLVEVSLLTIPLAGAQAQGGHRFAFRLLQSCAQSLGKQGMVAIPTSLPIELHDKNIGTLDKLEQILAVRLLHHCVTDGGPKP